MTKCSDTIGLSFVDNLELNLMRIERMLLTAATTLNDTLASIVAEGVTGELAIQRALAMQANIAAAFAEYDAAAGAAVATYAQAARDSADALIAMGVPAVFVQEDADLLLAMMQNVRSEIAGLSLQTQASVTESIYTGAVTGMSKMDMVANIKQLVLGQTDKRGNPMLMHAQTILRTGYMEVDSVVQRKKAGEAGIETFKYVGATVRDSRPWCVEHVGKVFTLAEIKEWESAQWAGKKQGDPFVVRGGWNCTHHFRAAIVE